MAAEPGTEEDYAEDQPTSMSLADFRKQFAEPSAEAEPPKTMKLADFRAQFAEPQKMKLEDFKKQFTEQPKEEPEGVLATGVRHFVHALPSMATGALVGTAVGGIPGLIAGTIAGGVEAYGQRKLTEAVAPEEAERLRAGEEAHPYAAVTGEVASGAGPFRIAGTLAQRALPAVISGGIDVAQQLALKGQIDPTQTAIATAGGAAFGAPRAPIERAAERLGARFRGAPAAAPTPPEAAPEAGVPGQDVQHGAAGPTSSRGASEPPRTQPSDVTPGDQPPAPRTGPGPEEAAKPARVPEGAPLEQQQAPRPPEGVITGEDPAVGAAFRAREPEMPAAPPAPPAEAVPPAIQTSAERYPAMQRYLEERYPEQAAMARQQQLQQQQQEQRPPRPPVEALERTAAETRDLTEAGVLPRTATGGAGMPPPEEPMRPGGLPPREPPTATAEGLVEPTKSDLQQGTIASLRRMFVPMVSESAKKGAAALKQAYGPLAQLKEQTLARFTNDLHRTANGMSRDPAAFERFVDAYENNQVHTLPPEQQKLAAAIERGNDDFWNEIKKLPDMGNVEATKNYFTHMYDNSNGQVDKFVSDWFGASGGSLRKRLHPTFADARAAGLKPLSSNPIEYFTRYSEGMSHYLAQRNMIADLEGQGRIGWFGPKIVGASGTPQPHVRNAPREGYAELKPLWTQKNGQKAYAPRDVAETINQFYDAGLRRGQATNFYDFAQRTKNMWTSVELGLSAYHFTTMQVESLVSQMARTLQLAATGNFGAATKNMLQYEPWSAYRLGRQARQVYRGTAVDPSMKPILDLLVRNNIQPGNLHITGEYDMSRLGNLWDAQRRGSLPNEFNKQLQEIKDSYGLKLPQHLLDLTRRAMQTISKPLFEHYIPELKLGTMMKDLEAWLHANPLATDAEKNAAAGRIANSIDNRMGEMNMDNLFMNKAAKQLGMLTLRSFGFTVGGPFREIGAGIGAMGKRVAQGKSPFALSLKGEHDPRTAYAMAFLPTIAAISAAYQYMRTGKGPEDWRDLATPKTGGTVKSIGQQVPERMLVPGYHKDFLGYFVNPAGPLHEVEAKMAAPWTAIKEQLTGKDWRDKPYVPPRATMLEWLAAHGKALGSHMLPIGQKQLAEGRKPGSALTLPEQAIGVRTPGAYMQNPKGLEAYLSKQAQRDWAAKEKQENRTRREQGLPPLPPRRLPPPPAYARGGPVLQQIGQRRYQEKSHAASQ